MDFGTKIGKLQNGIHELIQGYQNILQENVKYKTENEVLQKEKETLTLCLENREEIENKLLETQQDLIPRLMQLNDTREKQQQEIRSLKTEIKTLKDDYENRLKNMQINHDITLTNLKQYYENAIKTEKEVCILNTANSDIRYDRLKTEMQKMQKYYEDNLKQQTVLVTQQRSEIASAKTEMNLKEENIQDLQDQIKQLNHQLKTSQEKFIALDAKVHPSKYVTTSSGYRKHMETSLNKQKPLNVNTHKLKDEISRIEILSPPNSNATQLINDQIYKSRTESSESNNNFTLLPRQAYNFKQIQQVPVKDSVVSSTTSKITAKEVPSINAYNYKFSKYKRYVRNEKESENNINEEPSRDTADADSNECYSINSILKDLGALGANVKEENKIPESPEKVNNKRRKLYNPNDYSYLGLEPVV